MLTKKIVYGWSRPRSWGGELKLKSHISFLVTHTKRGMRRSEPHKFWPNTAREINPGLKHKKSHLLLLKFDWWQSDLAKWWCLERVWAVPVTTLHYSLITSLWSLSGDHMVRQETIILISRTSVTPNTLTIHPQTLIHTFRYHMKILGSESPILVSLTENLPIFRLSSI